MQFLFKTAYNDDIRFLAKTGEKIRVAIVVAFLLAAPLFLQNYYLAELGLLLVYAIAGIGLMILTGHTGQVSFGHAAFLGIGAYCHSILMSKGVPLSTWRRSTSGSFSVVRSVVRTRMFVLGASWFETGESARCGG